MDTLVIERQFEKMGARAKFHPPRPRQFLRSNLAINIGRDADGEFFDLTVGPAPPEDLVVLDVQPRVRHLLLMTRDGGEKHKFLCGHDERHWFVAAVPERAPVSTVKTAFEALQPARVRRELDRKGVRVKNRHRRRNDAFLRQGEWFFVPTGRVEIPGGVVLRDEPLRRGGGKPHRCEELVRTGGETVYVSARHPNGLTQAQYAKLLDRNPAMRGLQWVAQRRNPEVFVRGKVRHADHKTIVLDGWHRVLMNTETEAAAMRHVAFID